MFAIKKLYAYILKSFLPMFAMTFAIVLFILLMQFLWKYVDDFVGKGLDLLILAEIFFYAALNLIPLALPLAILLASLITFGDLGESFELTAIKASGISLFKTMRPLVIFIVLVCISAFFFQNEAIPRIGIKFTTLMRSIQQKSPEVAIPEGSFYSEIKNYSIYVKKKDRERNMLRGVMIYDVSKGFENMTVIVCDSAKMKVSSQKDYLLLTLYSGQSFYNLPRRESVKSYSSENNYSSFTRENFKTKEVIISFDTNFNRMSESNYNDSQIAKNITQLDHSIDSLNFKIDSLNRMDRRTLAANFLSYRRDSYIPTTNVRAVPKTPDTKIPDTKKQLKTPINLDSILRTCNTRERTDIYNAALGKISQTYSNYLVNSQIKMRAQQNKRAHKVEWHRKFTFSFACLIFFFIGAPLGAIIRKGGLGVPVVVSVGLFIIYYIIDNVGFKMARDGVWPAWQGIWLSSMVLFPLGVFLTYQAMNDSAILNSDAYRKLFIHIFKRDTWQQIIKNVRNRFRGQK